jgi:predicted RNA-binding Zn ribbon-like protein
VFRWLGEPLAIDYANTVMVVRAGQAVDLIATPAELKSWLHAERERLGDCDFAVAHIEEIRSLRDSVRDLLSAAAQGVAPPSGALDAVNAASARVPSAPQLQINADGEFRKTELAAADPLRRLLAQLARSAADLLSGPGREQLHVCDAPSCGMVFLGSRRWCCGACGNRARAARHYRRKRAQAA